MNKKLKNNWQNIINECVSYFGEHNRNIIEEKANKLKIVIVPKGNNKIEFLGGEPFCVKKPSNTFILAPEYLFSNEEGNHLFMNQFIRAITEDTFSLEGKDTFNSTLISMISDDICSKLEEKDINITNCDYPNYKSESFFDNFMSPMRGFFSSNKQNVLDAMLRKNAKISDNVKAAIEQLEEKTDSFYEEQVERLEEYSLAFNKKR